MFPFCGGQRSFGVFPEIHPNSRFRSCLTLRRELDIWARQSLSRESITNDTILAPCNTTVPTLAMKNIIGFVLFSRVLNQSDFGKNLCLRNISSHWSSKTTWFCFKCATFKRSISGSLKAEDSKFTFTLQLDI